jgi:hypothetical protein
VFFYSSGVLHQQHEIKVRSVVELYLMSILSSTLPVPQTGTVSKMEVSVRGGVRCGGVQFKYLPVTTASRRDWFLDRYCSFYMMPS